ncbi:murein biosynthesis integral membrane protein MurJ [Oleidesulfovibrio sp.]|uniref:murein biosynthesis integral membrane protein MurJ n=1 Tax=Oleidesulfovibrio sp. TaxID=2909707 RepID=UPI003A86632B
MSETVKKDTKRKEGRNNTAPQGAPCEDSRLHSDETPCEAPCRKPREFRKNEHDQTGYNVSDLTSNRALPEPASPEDLEAHRHAPCQAATGVADNSTCQLSHQSTPQGVPQSSGQPTVQPTVQASALPIVRPATQDFVQVAAQANPQTTVQASMSQRSTSERPLETADGCCNHAGGSANDTAAGQEPAFSGAADTAEHQTRLARNVAVIGSATLVSRVLGFIRDAVLAFALGTGPLADAFLVAFRLPNLLRRLFGEGSLSMAFVSVFATTQEQQGRERAFELARSMFFWVSGVLGVLCIAGVLAAPVLTALIAPGFLRDAELFQTAVEMVRICFPYAFFICLVALCMGVLNGLDKFAVPALAPCILNIVLIGAALFALVSGVDMALTLAWAVPVAGAAQLAFMLAGTTRAGFPLRGAWRLADPHVARVGKLLGPTVAGAAVYQLTIVLGTLLASYLPSGSISSLYFADRLVQFPLGVFGVAVGTAALPCLASLHGSGRRDEFLQTLSASLRLSLFISLPAAAGLAALATPLVWLIFGRGAFDAAAAQNTVHALLAYAPGVPAIALVRPLVAAFYAQENTRTPVLFGVASLVVYLGTALLLMPHYGHVGLALAGSVSAWANAVLLWCGLVRSGCAITGIARQVLLYAVMSAVMGGSVAGAATYIDSMMLAVALLVPAGAAVYGGAALLLRLEDAHLLTGACKARR